MNQRLRIVIKTGQDWRRLARAGNYQLSTMAVCAGVSVAHLRRLCRRQMDEGLSEWVRTERLVAARLLLAETGSVKITAALLGYRQRSQFSREFQQVYGVPASGFAARYKEWHTQLAA